MMFDILRKIVGDKPEKATTVLKGNCSDCGCETIIEITATSGGFGLLGGGLFKRSPDEYLMRCPACCEKNKDSE